MKKLLAITLTIILIATSAFAFAACGSKEEPEEDTGTAPGKGGKTIVEMKVKDYGIIKIEIDEGAAPKTAENFLNLVNDKFYDGLTFHRTVKGFMIQGGDPEGTGMGGTENTIEGEFSNNGYENPLKHVRGTISMARSQDPNSASCQFFICDADSSFLDGEYAAFGTVTEGLEVVDKIADINNETIPKDKQPVIEYIKVI